MKRPPHFPILIAGPTASGKSALAAEIARELGGLVINADSMQVYAGLRVLTARPSDEELAQAPHAIYGHVPAREAYSVARWLADVQAVLDDAHARGLVPIIVGGTGLYFKSLLEGLSPVPAIPEDVRARWRKEARQSGAAALHAMLRARDPRMAERLQAGDAQRIVRALEVHEATGRSLADWQTMPGKRLIDGSNATKVLVMPDRETLHARADARFEAMMGEGALDEVRALATLGLDAALPVMGALGVRPLLAHLRGLIAQTEAVAAGKLETRQYIKRQQTWARRYMADWTTLAASERDGVLQIVQSSENKKN